MKGQTYDIYYDEDGDFLEVSFGEPSQEETTDEVKDGVFISRDIKTNEIKSVGILSFKKRTRILQEMMKMLKLRLPLKVEVE